MRRGRAVVIFGAAIIGALAIAGFVAEPNPEEAKVRFTVTYGADKSAAPLYGRLLLIISNNSAEEPRFQITDNVLKSQQIFGIDVNGWKPGSSVAFEGDVLGFPARSLAELPPGQYRVQALLHRYESFRRSDGHLVKLPMDRGEGQQWNKAPGNLYSTPRDVTIDPAKAETIAIALDQVIPPIPDPPSTKYVRHEKFLSERLSKFWGRPMYLGVHVLLPEGFDEHPNARYPLVINHGHFPDTIGGWREEPADPKLAPKYSERFRVEGYNRVEQEEAYQLYKDWTAPGYPRYLLIEIQHANPYYDDSYAVNSQNLGPYGDAITYELIPYIEKKYRAIGAGWARFLYGGSTGGWESLAAQILYPDEYNGCWAACPDPIDFRQYTVINIMTTRTRTSGRVRSRVWRLRRTATISGICRRRSSRPTVSSSSSARTDARAVSGTSGRPSIHRSVPTVTRSPSGTSGRESSTSRSRPSGRRTTTSLRSCSATGRRASGRNWSARSTSTSAKPTTTTSTTPCTSPRIF
jgi:hypothetical protein